MPSLLSVAPVLALSLLAAACIPGMTPGAPGAPGAVGGGGNMSPATAAANIRITQQDVTNCEGSLGRATAKFKEAMDKMSAKPSAGDLVAKLRDQKVDVKIDLATIEMPLPMMKDSFMDEGQKAAAAGQPALQAFAKRAQVVTPIITPLRTDVNVVGGALMSAALTSCHRDYEAHVNQIAAIRRGGGDIPPELMAGVVKLASGSKKADGMFAASVALIGTMQAGFAGKNPKAIDAAVEVIVKNDPTVLDSSEAEVKARMDDLDKTFGSTAGAEIKGPPPAAGASGGCSASGAAGTAINVASAIPNPGVQQAAGMACEAVAGLTALKNGDFGGAVKSASKLAPGPLGPALGALSSFF